MKDCFKTMHGMHTVEDMEFMFECMQYIPKTGLVVNLGVYRGKSCMVFCEGLGSHRVVGIDNWRGGKNGGIGSSFELAKEYIEEFGYNPEIITGDSCESYDIREIACLFIDTKHTAIQLENELQIWMPLLLDDAVVMLHDYHDQYSCYKGFIDFYFKEWEFLGLKDRTIGFKRR